MNNITNFSQLVGKGNNGRFLQFNVYKKIFADINKKIKFSPQDQILDLGGGCGELTGFIAKQCNHVILADGSEIALNYAKRKLKKHHNISYQIADITKLPLSFNNNQFDKIICYSVVHYVKDLENFKNLIEDLIRMSKHEGVIFIGDIPLTDKYKRNLEERKKYPIKNFLLNQKYYIKKGIINLIHKLRQLDVKQVKGTNYTKEILNKILDNFKNINYKILSQDKHLPLANSREDLLIIKTIYEKN
jgi:ubiquinone/menaquinone biosynthesis C-methylase UbiE